MEVWMVVSESRDWRPGTTTQKVTHTIFAHSAEQAAIDYAANMDVDGWKSHIELHMVLTVVPVNVRQPMARSY